MLLLSILGAIALGLIVVLIVCVTISWLVARIKEKKAKDRAKKLVVADLKKLIKENKNTVSMEEFEKLADEGTTHIIVSVDANDDIVGDVETVKDKNRVTDEDVSKLLRKGDGMVIIE